VDVINIQKINLKELSKVKMVSISEKKIKEINLDKYMDDIYQMDDIEFYGDCGRQHYRLLAYLSTLFNNSEIFDIGTHRGSSALALSYNSTNKVYSFDIENRSKNYINKPENIEFIIFNLFNNNDNNDNNDNNELEKWRKKLLNSPLIFLDIDPHDGILEYEFYQYLLENNYRGLLILDDIHHFEGMRVFWDKIKCTKYDITSLGHWSGTGLVKINNDNNVYIYDDENNYTLITAYFDLTKCPDASDEIKKRDGNYYLNYSKGCLHRNNNMVIFCDPEFEKSIWEIRPKDLHNKTRVIPISFEDMKMTKFRSKIIENRIKNPYYFDNRNTASYYLLCMARYDAIKRVIEENPFNSTHFAWINICIERMGPKNLENLDIALSQYRDKFSTCYIAYIPPHFTVHLKDYYQWGRCSLCSGFFTGNKEYMYTFCQKIEEAFLDTLDKGYGHADEQLFLIVYFKHPELFEFYYGDYQQMITNYTYIKENEYITSNLISNSFKDNNYIVCYDACKFLWKSYMLNYITISDINLFLKYFFLSSLHTNNQNFFFKNVRGKIYREFLKSMI
jgi:hypothetical protein